MTVYDSMRRHPAGKHLPESDEVAQARMDEEACAINRPTVDERHHRLSTGRYGRLLDAVVPFLIGLILFGVVFGSAILGELAGGWPA